MWQVSLNRVIIRLYPKEKLQLPVTEGIYKKTLVQLIKIFTIFLFLAVINSFLQVFVIFQSREIIDYRARIKSLEKEISQIKVEIASLESFERIQTIALNELGMRAPTSDDYHWVEAMPAASKNVSLPNYTSSEMVKADLWEQLHQWLGNLGKTMAQSL